MFLISNRVLKSGFENLEYYPESQNLENPEDGDIFTFINSQEFCFPMVFCPRDFWNIPRMFTESTGFGIFSRSWNSGSFQDPRDNFALGISIPGNPVCITATQAKFPRFDFCLSGFPADFLSPCSGFSWDGKSRKQPPLVLINNDQNSLFYY